MAHYLPHQQHVGGNQGWQPSAGRPPSSQQYNTPAQRPPARWRRNVVAVIFNEDGHVLGCNRKDRKGWQCVQGGVEDNDSELLAAAWREIDEEVGLQKEAHRLEFVAPIPPPNGDPTALRYLLPKYAAPSLRAQGFIGQQQELLLFFAPKGSIQHVRLVPTAEQAAAGAKQEFRGVAWLPFEEFITKTADIKMHIFSHMHVASRPLILEFLDRRFGHLTTAPTVATAQTTLSSQGGERPSKRDRDVSQEEKQSS